MALRYLARRYQSLDTEIAELKIEIRRLCAEANPKPPPVWALNLLVASNPGRMKSNGPSLRSAAPAPSPHHRDRPSGTVSTGEATAKPTARSGGSLPPGYAPTQPPTNRGTAPRGRKEPKRDHPLPQAAHRPTDLPPLDQPATNPELRPAPPPTPTSHITGTPPTLSEPTPAASPHRTRHSQHQLASRYQTWLQLPAPSPT